MEATKESYKVRVHHIDPNGCLALPSMIRMMQDASMINAQKLGVSIGAKLMDNTSWVLLRKEIHLHREALLDEVVSVVTYPTGFNRVFAYRDYWLIDTQEQVIATASSTWALMDLDQRKAVRVPDPIAKISVEPVYKILKQPEAKLNIASDLNFHHEYQVQLYDLDWNAHVNNIILTRLMLQSVGKSYFTNHQLVRYNYHIKAECHYGETLKMYQQQVDEHTYHHQITNQDGELKAMGVSEWRVRAL